MKNKSSNMYNIFTMYNKSQGNLKASLRKLNYKQKILLLTTWHNRGIHKINPKSAFRDVISSK